MQFNPTTVIMLVILVGLVFLMFRNSRKRKAQQEEMTTKMVPGARVMLSFGLFGRLVSVDDEKVTADVEVAPGTVITVHRQTLSRVVNDEDTAAEPVAAADGVAADAPVSGVTAVARDRQPMELNGEPVYGERVDDPADIEAAKRERDER